MPVKGSKTGVNKNCKNCGKEFYVHLCHVNVHFFCCKACYTKSQIGNKLLPHVKKIALENLRRGAPNRVLPKGESNHKWKGGQVGYRALHYWIERQLGKASKCNRCPSDSNRFHWHNLSGDYRRDISDWESLCAKCHKKEHKK